MTQRVTQPRFRPSDLLPWADPHIRSLVEQLQEEVREEASQRQGLADRTRRIDPAPESGFDMSPLGRRF